MTDTQEKPFRSAFVLNPHRFGAIIELIASHKRSSMHHLMRKSGKNDQHNKDLHQLLSHQAFVTGANEGTMKGSTLMNYEKLIHNLAEVVGNEAQKNPALDLTKLLSFKQLPFPAASYINMDTNVLAQSWVPCLLTIYEEVHRKPKGPEDMIHTEYMEIGAAAKEEKAAKGRTILNNSCAGIKKPRKMASSLFGKVLLLVHLERTEFISLFAIFDRKKETMGVLICAITMKSI